MLAFLLTTAIGVQVTFEARELANLTAHLDCLSGVRRCVRKAYVALWQKEIGWATEDEKRLDDWRAMMLDPGVDWQPSQPRPDTTYPLPLRLLLPEKSLRVIGMQARDLSDYEERLGLVVSPKIASRGSQTFLRKLATVS